MRKTIDKYNRYAPQIVMANKTKVEKTVRREHELIDNKRTSDVPNTAPVYFGHFHRTKS